MKRFLKFVGYFLIFIILSTCGEKPETPNRCDIELTVTDANGALVTGIANGIYILGNESDYSEAFAQRGTTKSLISSAVTEIYPGVYSFSVDDIRDQTPYSYYLYVYKFDNTNSINMSNFALNGAIRRLPSRAKISMKTEIRPDDGNLVFFSSATNLMPISISVTGFDTVGVVPQTKVISQVFTGTGIPNFIDGFSSAWFNFNPGRYTYYAKSNDGCVWQGIVSLQKGIGTPVSLSKCPTGKISFYTESFNSSVLPVIITINGQNISNYFVQTLTGISPTAVQGSDCANINSSGVITFSQTEGLYSFSAESFNNQFEWTGQVQIGIDQCTIIGLGNVNR